MKRILLTLAVLAAAQFSLMANPAYPGKIPCHLPDGSVVYVRQHGDEWLHYTTDEAGRCVKRGPDGFLQEAEKPTVDQYEAAMRLRNNAIRPAGVWTPRTDMTIGERHIPVFLVEFQNKEFLSADPATDFNNLMNQRGYSYNGATGSVRDYYEDNSGGLFKPVFDVYGPVKVSGNYQDYGGSNYAVLACGAFWEVCKKLSDDKVVDFSNYDANNDGYVDMMLFFFAGFNQADGGGYYNVDTIWPHQWHIQYGSSDARTKSLNGKKLDRYFCTSELQGYQGSRRCGIGTTCHEFGHSLGLPDFYDTNYEENGEAGALYGFSIMCSGSRLNNENTPPYLNSEELRFLGWRNIEPEEISANGSYSLQRVPSQKTYTLSTSTDGECFMLEYRAKSGWDQYIPSAGLLVYHIDKSSRSISFSKNGSSYSKTAQYLWDSWESYNAINANGSHPLFYLIPAAKPSSLNYSDESRIPFPGASSVKSYLPSDWNGEDNRFKLSNIAVNGEECTFTVSGGAVPGVFGRIMNSSAQSLKNATVTLSTSSPKQKISSSVTDIDGTYSFELSDREPGTYILDVTCSGYVSQSVYVDIPRSLIEKNIYLLAEGETLSEDLKRYNTTGTTYRYGNSDGGQAAAIAFSEEEMGVFQGKQFMSITFIVPSTEDALVQTGDFYVFLEVGGKRIFTQKVDSPDLSTWVTVNVSGQGYVIDNPDETKIGLGVLNNSLSYPFYFGTCPAEDLGYYANSFSLSEVSTWGATGWPSRPMYLTPYISARLGTPVGPDLGFHYISNPGSGVYSSGDRFSFELVQSSYDEAVQSISWYYDGTYTAASSVSLTAGRHEIKAVLSLTGGGTNTLSLSIQVN